MYVRGYLQGSENDRVVTIAYHVYMYIRGRRGRDRMVVGFTTTYAISAYLSPLTL